MIVDYSKLDRDTLNFIREKIKKVREGVNDNTYKLGLMKAEFICHKYWLEAFKSEEAKSSASTTNLDTS